MAPEVGSRLQIELHSYNALFTSRVFSRRLNALEGKPSNWFRRPHRESLYLPLNFEFDFTIKFAAYKAFSHLKYGVYVRPWD